MAIIVRRLLHLMRPLPFQKRMIIMLKEKQQVKQHSQVFLQQVIFYHLMEKLICYLALSKMQPMQSIL